MKKIYINRPPLCIGQALKTGSLTKFKENLLFLALKVNFKDVRNGYFIATVQTNINKRIENSAEISNYWRQVHGGDIEVA